MAGRILEQAESEFRCYREQMVENIGLNAFINRPSRIVRERIDFERQAVLAGRQLSDHHRHAVMNAGVIFQIIR